MEDYDGSRALDRWWEGSQRTSLSISVSLGDDGMFCFQDFFSVLYGTNGIKPFCFKVCFTLLNFLLLLIWRFHIKMFGQPKISTGQVDSSAQSTGVLCIKNSFFCKFCNRQVNHDSNVKMTQPSK